MVTHTITPHTDEELNAELLKFLGVSIEDLKVAPRWSVTVERYGREQTIWSRRTFTQALERFEEIAGSPAWKRVNFTLYPTKDEQLRGIVRLRLHVDTAYGSEFVRFMPGITG